MSLFKSTENRVKCGKCNTEFDFNKNSSCPLCGFGENSNETEPDNTQDTALQNQSLKMITKKAGDYLSIPPYISLSKGKIILDEDAEAKTLGLWGMVNDYFSGKMMLRINANLIKDNGAFYELADLIEIAKSCIQSDHLYRLKGFPNDIKSESSMGRLVQHFVKSFWKMGLFEVKHVSGKNEKKDIWNEPWNKIMIRPTQEGLEFSRLKNKVFDDHDYENQILTAEEKEWLMNYLKKLDSAGFKEYTTLKEVYSFIKQGHNGKQDLWNWFSKNPKFRSYIKSWSAKSDNSKEFEKQIMNLAVTFSAGKVSLLRELGLIKNKRNDYTVIGELR